MVDVAELQRGLLSVVRERGGAKAESVADALLAVPRHMFVPDVSVDEAYRDEAIVTERDAQGVPMSSSSQPTIMALMLDQLDVASGQRVLEIGTGSGYNAGLLAQLVGPAGMVVSVEIDPRVAARAGTILSAAGCSQVWVVCADGADGYSPEAPYDRIIATVGVWDLAPAWLDQLASDGRLVVPLDLHGAQVSVAFEREDGHWASRSLVPCGFMRLRGALAGPEQVVVLDQSSGLMLSVPDARDIDRDGVWAALTDTPVAYATGVVGGGVEAFGGLGVWLAVTAPQSCVVSDEHRGSAALESALVNTEGFRATWGIVDGASIALLGRRIVANASSELDVHGFGPDGDRLAVDLVMRVRAWDSAGRTPADRLRVAAYPRNTTANGGGVVLDKVHTRLVVSGLTSAGALG
jgi:protein-L-isoaspartate(D-aspartate) O-methyltransferase